MRLFDKDGMYELPNELPNGFRLRKLGNSKKSQNFIELKPSAQPYFQNENFVNTSKKLRKIEIELSP